MDFSQSGEEFDCGELSLRHVYIKMWQMKMDSVFKILMERDWVSWNAMILEEYGWLYG